MLSGDLFGKKVIQIDINDIHFFDGLVFFKLKLLKKLGAKKCYLDIIKDALSEN